MLVVGTSGSGKSTLARALASALGSTYVEQDAIRWLPGWTLREDLEFGERLEAAAAGERWVIDGNVRHRHLPLWDRTTLVVWLDYPLHTVMRRLLRRTFRRIVRREALWAGNRETLGRLLGRDSIVLWALQSHGPNRRTYEGLIALPPRPGLEFRRLRRPAEADGLLREASAAARPSGDDPRRS